MKESKNKSSIQSAGGKAVFKKYGPKHFSDMKKKYWADVKRKLAKVDKINKK